MKLVAQRFNLDIFDIIKIAATKPFGFTPFFPGPGLGGHCIPIDPFYLSWKAKEYGMNLKFIELAGEINSSMPNYVVNKISEYFNNNCKTIKNSKIIMLGLSYKKNVDDLRESPSLKIADLLLKLGAQVSYSDPYFEILPKLRNYNKTVKLCHSTVGKAILNTSITIVFGFSILVMSNFIPTIYFGVFTGIAMLLAMVSVLTLLPSLLLKIKPFN